MTFLSAMDSARLAVDALEAAGVRQVVVAPGSRSAPLAYALAEAAADGRMEIHVRIDERVAGFTALGLALGAGVPAAVVTTSGTAVGNLMPAVMEANHAGVPLVVLSADRPEELRGTGANQTTMQLDLFGEHVRFATDVPAGTDPTSAVATGLSASQGRLAGIPAGPVQINLAFRDPLTPPLDGTGWQSRGAALSSAGQPDGGAGGADDGVDGGKGGTAANAAGGGAAVGAVNGISGPTTPDGAGAPDDPFAILLAEAEAAANQEPAPQTADSQALDASAAEPVRTEHCTLVLAGHGAGPSAEVFARELGLPLLAEPSSNARYGANAVGPYRLLLEKFGPDSAWPIERVVVFGRPTLSRPVAALLARTDIERALYLPRPVAWFEPGRRPELVLTQWGQLAGFAGHGPSGWLEAWQDAAAAAEEALDAALAPAEGSSEAPLDGLSLARAVWERASAEPGSNLVLGSSNPIRDADLAGRPVAGHLLEVADSAQNGVQDSAPEPAQESAPAVFANRGLAGIDGTVATATGIALASGRPTRVLLGDLTLLHDAGALLLGTGEREADLQVVVLNDGGGGIFSLLEHGTLGGESAYAAAVERLFGTPQTADLAKLAAAYGWRHQSADSVAALDSALAVPVRGRSILEVHASRADLRPLHQRVRQAVLG